MERKTKPMMSKLRLPFFRRWKGQRASSSASTDISADAFILFDKNLDIVGMNPLARSLFHLILGENVIGEDILNGAPKVKPDNKNNGRHEKYLNAIRKGKPFFADSIVIHSGLLDINLKAEAFKVGKGFGIIFSDLDALRAAEKTPYDPNKGSAINLQSVPDCIFVFDLKGTILHGSRAGERLTGYAWEEVKGKTFFEIPLLAPEFLPKAAQLLELSAAGQSTGPDEFELIRKDGSQVFVDISACPIGRGEEVEVVAIAHDITERKKSEETLRQSEEKYKAIVETSLDGIYQVDASGKFTFINESFANIFGYRREELLDKHFFLLLSTETIPNVVEMVKEVLSGKSLRNEVPVQHKDGHEVPVSFSATPLKDCGKIVGLTGILRDMTERKRMEEELANSEARYRSLVETAGAGVAAIDLRGDIVLVNEALCRMIGYSPEELLGRNFADFLHQDDRTEVLEIFAKRLAGVEERPHLEFRGIHKDCHTVWLYSSPTAVILEKEIIGFSAVINDITQRKQVEEAMKLGEQNYRLLFNSTADSMFVIDAETMKLVLVNRAGMEMAKKWGLGSTEDIASVDMLDYIHPDDRDRALRIIAEDMFEKDLRQTNEFRVVTRDGTEHWISGVGTRTEYQGRMAGLLSVRDITQRKRAEDRERELGRGLEFLAKTSMSLLELPADANVYYFIAERLQELAEGSVILVNSFDEDSGTFCVREALGIGEQMEALTKILGVNLIGMHIPERDAWKQSPTLGELGKVSGGIYELASGAMPISVCQEIEKLLGVGNVYAIGLTWKGKLYGSAVIATRGRTELRNTDVIQTFVRQASMALQRRQSEEALKESEEKYRALVEAAERSGEGIIIVQDVGDVEASLVFVNDEFCKMVGYSREESLKMSAQDLIPPDEFGAVHDRYKRRQKGEEVSSHYEVNLRCKDGTLIPIEVGIGTMIYRGRAATVVFLRDITERKKAEEELHFTRFALDNAVEAMVCVSQDARYIDANDTFCRSVGYSREELLSMTAHDIDPNYSAKIWPEFWEKLKRSGSLTFESCHRTKDGEVTPVEVTVTFFEYKGKEYHCGFARDITERKKAEEALKDSEGKWRSLTENSPDHIMLLDLDLTILFINRTVPDLAKEEVIGTPNFKYIPPEYHQIMADCYKRVAASGKPDMYTTVYRTKEGEYRWFEVRIGPVFKNGQVVAFTSSSTDITERKKAEEALQEVEENFEALADNAIYGILVGAGEGNHVYANKRAAEITGYSVVELLKTNIKNLAHPDELKKLMEGYRRRLEGEPVTRQYETIIVRKDGKSVPVEIAGTKTVWKGKPADMVIVYDITERKRAEQTLQQSEERFRNVLDNSLDMVYRLNLQTGTYDYVSPSTEKILGYSPEEFVAFTIEKGRALAHPDDLARLDQNVIELVTSKGGTASSIEYRIKHKELGYCWVSDIRSVVYDDENAPVAVVGNLRDITEHKKEEEALRESEEKYRLLAENVTDVIWTMDMDLRFTYISPSVTCLRGLTVKEAMAERLEDIFSPSSFQALVKTFEEGMVAEATGLRDQSRSWTLELEENCKDGSLIWVEIRAGLLRDQDGRPVGLVGVTRNITERKKMEEALRESESKFRSVLEHSVDVIYQVNLKTGTYDYVSPSSVEALGYSPEKLIALGFEKATPVTHPDDVEMILEHFNKLIKRAAADDKEPRTIEYRVKHRKLGYRWMSDTSSVLCDEKNVPIAIVGNVRDITERRKAEEALKESEERYRALVDTAGSAGEGIMIVERADSNKAVIAFVNDALSGMLGYQREEMLGMPARDLFLPGDRIWLQDKHRKRRKGEALSSHYAVMALRKDGSMLPIEISMGAMSYHGKNATVVYVRDVTERKQAEEALRESEAQFRAIFDGAAIGVGLLDINGQPFRINPALREMLGYALEELSGRAFSEYLHPDDAKVDLGLFREMVAGKRDHYQVEKRFFRKDGQMVWGLVTLSAVRGLGGKLKFAIGMVEDITESKLALENLRKSEEHFRALTENALDAIVIIDKDGSIIYTRPGSQPARGYKPEEIIGTNSFAEIHPEDMLKAMSVYNELVQNPSVTVNAQVRVRHKDGSWRIVEAIARNLIDNPAVAGIVINYRDVTERNIALEKLRQSEERFRSLIENASEVVLILDKEGITTYASPSVERILGYKLEEGIGKASFSFVHPDDMPLVMDLFSQMIQDPGSILTTKLHVRHKDGSWRVVEAIGKNLLDDHAVEGIVAHFWDVTEREQEQEELLRHMRHVEALHAIAQAASQTLELEELLNTALDKVIEVMESEAGCVYLLDMVEKELVLRTSRGLSDETISRLATIKLNGNNVQKIMEWKGGSTPLRKIFEETGLSITAEVKEKEQIQSFAVAPFAVRGQLSGLIAVGNRAHRKFSPGDIDLLRAVGNQIGIGTQNAMLYEEVRALIRETIDAQETERERVCLEVHDGVAQTLVSAFQYLQALEVIAPEDAQTKQLLAKTTTQIKQAIQESREIINSLQPATLSDLGLVSTLRHELKRLGQETGLKIDFKADAIRFPKDVEVGLYRIIHEAVFNARKHADTRRLRVKISSEDAGVRVEVRDWGKGFDQAYLARSRRRGTGLFSIRKRAELLKGTCEIESKPGEGTMVCVEIPFSAAEISSG